MRKVLGKKFFNRDTPLVAQELLGKYLVRKIGTKEVASMITEVEAYDGFKDKASHASKGETPRNSVMFQHPGFWYVYLCYGMYDMLNIVTREKGYPAAILIRGTQAVSGPGRLTKKFHISRKLNKTPASKKTGLWIEDRGVKISPKSIQKTPRIGVAYAGSWAHKPWRFVLKEKEKAED